VEGFKDTTKTQYVAGKPLRDGFGGVARINKVMKDFKQGKQEPRK
jgi:hypothetical protein